MPGMESFKYDPLKESNAGVNSYMTSVSYRDNSISVINDISMASSTGNFNVMKPNHGALQTSQQRAYLKVIPEISQEIHRSEVEEEDPMLSSNPFVSHNNPLD
jgi:hypothetical protein